MSALRFRWAAVTNSEVVSVLLVLARVGLSAGDGIDYLLEERAEVVEDVASQVGRQVLPDRGWVVGDIGDI
jgi:hypothetical protein